MGSPQKKKKKNYCSKEMFIMILTVVQVQLYSQQRCRSSEWHPRTEVRRLQQSVVHAPFVGTITSQKRRLCCLLLFSSRTGCVINAN